MKLVSNPAFEWDAAKARRPLTLRSAAEGVPVNEPRAHLVFLRTGGLLLVKRPETDWRQLQDEYAEYMASLGPWTAAEIAEHFTLDYTEDDARWPFTRRAITEFMQSPGLLVLDSDAEAEPVAAADTGRVSAFGVS